MWKRWFGRKADSVASNIPGARRPQDRTPSPWIYGSGASRPRLSLPPITRYTTSSPTGSSDPGPWATPTTLPNRPRSNGH
jgi:hypothetical protein